MFSGGGSVAGKQLEVRGAVLKVLMGGEQGLGRELVAQSQEAGQNCGCAAWFCTVVQISS